MRSCIAHTLRMMKPLPIVFCLMLVASISAQPPWWGGNPHSGGGYNVGGGNNYHGGGGNNHHGGGGHGGNYNNGGKVVCNTYSANGDRSRCPRGYTALSCSCGKACHSWNIYNGNTCHCRCARMRRTTATCCKIES
ncbi:uncharacterized protein LOC128663652 [Bombina bombina]|uniref:uncharacterized protein LOC128663652 n=1 Tax=Bombina bombina TaxID=8345 RepID=UPI00235A5301|nr:uncharacterized protein LOC128663652 [Bombina bombina]